MGASASSSPRPGALLEPAVRRAGARLGPLPAEGRYHRAPERLADHYEVESEALGVGANGTVVAARRRRTGARVAVKSCKVRGMGAEQRRHLSNEVEILLGMDHPHVARLVDVFECECLVCMVMECMEGGELFERLLERGVFPEADAADATRQMLLAVNYIHAKGVVHRDLKLENFLYDRRGSSFLKMIDFGFGRFFNDGKRMVSRLGSPTYVAPEVLGMSYTAGSCDLWSLGVIVFALLGGYMPFFADSESGMLHAILQGRYTMAASRWGSISREACDFVQRLLVVRPKQRLTAEQALAHPWLRRSRTGAALAEEIVDRSMLDALVSFSRGCHLRQACMRLMAWSLTSDEGSKVRDIFIELDRSSTGVIKRDDLQLLLENYIDGQDLDCGLIAQMVMALDGDDDGSIMYSDFIAAMRCTQLNMDGDLLREIFQRFDVEGRGYLTCDGLQRMLGKPPGIIDGTFAQADADHDGQLSMHDFVTYLGSGSAADGDEDGRPGGPPTEGAQGPAFEAPDRGCFRKLGASPSGSKPNGGTAEGVLPILCACMAVLVKVVPCR